MNFNRWRIFVSKKVKFEWFFFAWPLTMYFLLAKAMQNNFHEFEELPFFDFGFRIPDSSFWFLHSGFRLWIPVSGFRVIHVGLPG